jgi:predicted PhzF superfamily epimerase YddE/YHI9
VTTLDVLRVFVAADGTEGNLLGVFQDGSAVSPERRQAVASELGYSETVFVDEIAAGGASVRIFTPGRELPFAGHPTVGTSWLLRREGHRLDHLRCRAGDVITWQDGPLAWIRASPEWVHDIAIRQLASPSAVEALDAGTADVGYAWAWIDEPAGQIRSRYFAGDVGIIEDQATGAAAVLMGGQLRRNLFIRQGRGSELHVRVGPDAAVDVGGRVNAVERRSFEAGG